jgi:hypothetical protein
VPFQAKPRHATNKQWIQATPTFWIDAHASTTSFLLLRYPFYLGASVKAFHEATVTIMPAPTTWAHEQWHPNRHYTTAKACDRNRSDLSAII